MGLQMVLEIEVEKTTDDIPIIHIRGEIDLHTCSSFRETLRDLIDQKNYDIVIDLGSVPYLDSAALGVLVDAVRRVREYDGAIYLIATTPFVRRAFEITRLVKIFQLHDDSEPALASIRARNKSVAD